MDKRSTKFIIAITVQSVLYLCNVSVQKGKPL